MQIVGRQHELARLHEAGGAASSGRGRLALVGGEAGIGKTVLIEEFLGEFEERDVLVLDGAAYEAPLAPPFGVWIEALRDLPARDDLPALPREFRDATSDAPAESRSSLFHDVLAFLEELTRRALAVLVFEDLHWSDRASLDLLRYVGRGVARMRLLVIGSYRPEALQDTPLYECLPHLVREGPCERIQLRRLVTNDVRRLIGSRYGLEADDEVRLAQHLQDLADGNPLFIEELLRTLEGDRTLTRSTDTWRLGTLGDAGVPLLVQQLVDSRLAGLEQETSDAIGAAAVLGDEVALEDWHILVANGARLEPAIEHALRVQVMREVPGTAGRMRFTHAIVRRAVYARLLPTTRQRLHRQAAELLAPRPNTPPGVVAQHFELAGDQRAAVGWLIRAGDHAREIHAYESAVDHLTRALELVSDPEDEATTGALRGRAQAYSLLGDFGRAREDLEEALGRARRAADRQALWRLLLELGALWTERDYDEANSYLQQALELAREVGSDELIGASLNRVGNLQSNAERPRAAIGLHEEALAIFEALEDAAGIAETLDFLAIANYLHGDYRNCASLYHQALRRFREAGDLHGQASALPTLMCAGGSYDSETFVVASGSRAEWLRYGQQGIAAAVEAGWRAGEVYARIHAGYVQAAHGQYGVAGEMVDRGLALAERIGHRQWIVAGTSYRGAILNDLLQPERALAYLEQAYESAHETRSHIWIRSTAAFLVDACLQVDDNERAEHILGRVLASDSPMDSMAIRLCWMRRARLDLAQGKPAAALDVLRKLIASAPGSDPQPSIPHLDWLRGEALARLERTDGARLAFEQALERADELELHPLSWRIQHSLVLLHRATGEREAAAEARLGGREIIHRLSETIADDELRAIYLSRMPEEFLGGDPGDPDGDPFGLSEREREVLQVTSEGLTDGEIGVRLSISPRTVGRHLQSIYTKLGVNSRTAAVARAFEHDLIESASG